MTAALSKLAAGEYETAALWVLESNARARRFYTRAFWTADGSAKQEDIAGVPVTEVRYRLAAALAWDSCLPAFTMSL